MSKISCNIINDILPLYVDDVVSGDTKTMIEEHLAECSDCKDKCRAMKREIETDAIERAREAEKQAVLSAKKKLSRKRTVIAVISVAAGVLLISVVVFVLNYIKIPVEYEKNRFEFNIRQSEGNDCLYLDYTGAMQAYEQIEYYNGEKLIHAMFIYSTPWHEMFSGDDDKTKHEIFLTTIGNSETMIDEVRYITGDVKQFYEPTRNYDTLEEDSILLWSRDQLEDKRFAF